MWVDGNYCRKISGSFNDELLEIKGTLEDKDAWISFAKFLKSNPYYAVQLLIGIELYPFQDMVIKSMFQRDFFLQVCSRGLAKSTTASIFIPLYAIFNSGVKIGICCSNFRQSRMVFKAMEDMIKSPKGKFLAQCVSGKPSHNADAWEINFGTSKVVALPLGDGGKIRGYRFNVLVIDELLLLSETIVNEVLRPFLAVNIDPVKREKVKKALDYLIETGELTEEDRDKYQFPTQKMICLSSASYKFEYLYKMYKEYEEKVTRSLEKNNGEYVSHCIFQMSYKVAPKGLLNLNQIKEAQSTMSLAQFGR